VPRLKELHGKYADKGLVIVGISNESEDIVKSYMIEHRIPYVIGIDYQSRTFKTYGIRGIPNAVLVGADGKVIWRGHPLSIDESTIEDALKAVNPRVLRKWRKKR